MAKKSTKTDIGKTDLKKTAPAAADAGPDAPAEEAVEAPADPVDEEPKPAADKAEEKPKRRISPGTIALGLAGVIAIGVIGFTALKSTGTPEVSNNVSAAAPAQPTLTDAIAELRQRLSQDPDNHQGWATLGTLLKQDGQFADARAAFQRAMQLKPDEPDYIASYAEMILVDGGEETEREAESLFRRVLELRRDHPAPRYYLAILKDKRGQHREALDELIALLRDAPAGAPWETQVRDAAEKIARTNNIDIAGRLPERRTTPATAAIPGPTQQQMDDARGLRPDEQQDMVKGMVERLDARLRQNPRDERGWMMLMRSRIVQGEQQAAADALRGGLAAFSDDPAAQQRLRQAASELGIPAA